jgi:hypothetical protein
VDEDGQSRCINHILNWSKPGKTSLTLGVIVLVGVPVSHLLFFFVAVARSGCQKLAEDKFQADDPVEVGTS